MSLGRATGPLWAGYSYDIHQEYPFYSGALFQAITFALSFSMVQGTPPSDAVEEPVGK